MSSSTEAYKQIIENRISEINKQIASLSSTNHHYFTPDEIDRKIRGLKKELEILQEELLHIENRTSLTQTAENIIAELDSASLKSDARVEELQERIDELKNLRERLISQSEKRRIDREIKHNQNIIDRVKRGQTRIVGIQRNIMFPKYRRDLKRINLLAKAEQRIGFYEDKINDSNAVLDYLNEKRNTEGLSFREQFTEIKYGVLNYFQRRSLERSREIYNEMREHSTITMMAGARPISLGKKVVNKLRDRFGRTVVNQNTNINNGPAPVM